MHINVTFELLLSYKFQHISSPFSLFPSFFFLLCLSPLSQVSGFRFIQPAIFQVGFCLFFVLLPHPFSPFCFFPLLSFLLSPFLLPRFLSLPSYSSLPASKTTNQQQQQKKYRYSLHFVMCFFPRRGGKKPSACYSSCHCTMSRNMYSSVHVSGRGANAHDPVFPPWQRRSSSRSFPLRGLAVGRVCDHGRCSVWTFYEVRNGWIELWVT